MAYLPQCGTFLNFYFLVKPFDWGCKNGTTFFGFFLKLEQTKIKAWKSPTYKLSNDFFILFFLHFNLILGDVALVILQNLLTGDRRMGQPFFILF